MKRLLAVACILLGAIPTLKADHITGGEISYVFAGKSGDMYTYNVTVKMYMLCSSDRQFNDPAIVSVFNQATGVRVHDFTVPLGSTSIMNLSRANPCVTNPPTVCFRVGTYQLQLVLPASADGYIITANVVFRVDGMSNLVTGYSQVGATYTSVIPSNAAIANAPENNSATFGGDDLVVICADNSFTYNFTASDDDGDELRYSLCNAYQTGGITGNNGFPPPPPPYESVPYGNGYSGDAPLGSRVRIDVNSGKITGIAPSVGIYVITVCVEEIRGGVVIATQRKDMQINVASCDIAAAALPHEYIVCGADKTLTTKNISTSSLIKSYNWEFVNQSGVTVFNTTDPIATHTFADTGLYTVKLVINKGGDCSDSTESVARVYPGFSPDFNISGACINNPIRFNDATTSVYGVVNSWTWNFGDNNNNTASSLQNPSYTYPGTGNKNIRLIVADTKGCIDTVVKAASIFDKPPIDFAFRDTLICPPDALQLQATGNGNFTWSPQINMTGSSSAAPVVSPVTTTTYYAELNDDGCINKDSVMVRVVQQVSLQAMPDTIICEGDSAQLSAVSDGLRFSWTPSSTLNDASIINPVAVPGGTTVYQITASISTCTATKQINVRTVPYPVAYAGPDTIICYNTSTPLNASTDGKSFNWLPAAGLQDRNILNPIARPPSSTAYIFYAYDNKGCPKPGIDTVNVTVLPDINAFAGNDTAVIIGQPLQLQATGGNRYTWFPSTGLSATDIANPVAFFSLESPAKMIYRLLAFNEAGCVDSAFVAVKIFSSAPDIFVPNAFTPNNDGRNDIFEPVAAGIRHIDLFQVFNRWGQLMYTSKSTHDRGWDGTFKGEPMPSGTFVWVLKAMDFTGKPLFKKGTVVLIR